MTFNFEPNYTLLTFFFVKQFVFFELISVLALLRLILGTGWARLTSGLAFILSALGLILIFAPTLGITGLPGQAHGARMMLVGQGMVAMALPALLLLIGAIKRPRPAGWIEVLTCLALIGLVGLWIATMF